MGEVTTGFANAFADFDGTGAVFKPPKASIRGLGPTIEDYVSVGVAAEATLRANADTSINSALSGEISARVAAINVLATRAGFDEQIVALLLEAIGADILDTANALQALIYQKAAELAYLLDGSQRVDLRPGLGAAPRYKFAGTLTSPGTGMSIRQDNVLIAIPWGGQSLAAYATVGSPIATTPLYQGRALQPSDAFGRSLLHPLGIGVGGLIDLTEGQQPTNSTNLGIQTETIASSMLNHLIRDLDAALPGNNMQFVTWCWAMPGTAYAGLREGSQPFRWLTDTLAQVVAIAAQRGQRVVVPAMPWIHGETDSSFDGDRYYASMLQMQRQATEVIQAITGQTEEVVLLLNQCAYTHNGMSTSGQVIQATQLALGKTAFIRCVGPIYQYEGNPTDYIHKTSIGENKMGMLFGRAVRDEVFGGGFRPMEIVDAYWTSSTTIVAEMFVPVEPAVIDTTGDVNMTGSSTVDGFDITDPSGAYLTISSVTLTRASTDGTTFRRPCLTITLSAAITAPWVMLLYAQRRDGAENTADGPLHGARGALHDSAADVCLYNSSLGSYARPDNNWLCHTAMRVIGA